MCRGGGPIFTICSVWSLTLPQLEQSSLHPQQFSVIASCYRPPTTTISVFSYTSTAPEKENRSSNRLGTPLSRGLRSQKGLRPFNPLQKSNQWLVRQFNRLWFYDVLLWETFSWHFVYLEIYTTFVILKLSGSVYFERFFVDSSSQVKFPHWGKWSVFSSTLWWQFVTTGLVTCFENDFTHIE